MIGESKNTTKERIIVAAAKLFSEKGFDKVTTREITSAVGINPASLYYYFPSKDHLLKSLYKLYSEEYRKAAPDLNELTRLVETEPPHEVLMKAVFYFDGEKRGLLDQILVTAARQICADPASEEFIRKNIFEGVDCILRPLLRCMVERGKIKPFDVDTFLRAVSYYCFSAAALNNSIFKHNVKEYQAGMSFLFSVITPIEHADTRLQHAQNARANSTILPADPTILPADQHNNHNPQSITPPLKRENLRTSVFMSGRGERNTHE